MEQGAEGEKERAREQGEEKESDEAEDFEQAVEGAALEWQEGVSEDDLGLPIMHWEALSLRIAELEKQEEERKERSKCAAVLEKEAIARGWREERRDVWEDEDDCCHSRVIALTSRLQNQTNLQLCFINNSESEEEEEEKPKKKVPAVAVSKRGSKVTGLKLEVRAALSALKDKLCREQKEKECDKSCDTIIRQRRLEHSELQSLSLQQLEALRVSLTQNIHDLSSELVGRLLTRDQLRTEQDAMLLEVQDMTL